jgi:hypothetical protein
MLSASLLEAKIETISVAPQIHVVNNTLRAIGAFSEPIRKVVTWRTFWPQNRHMLSTYGAFDQRRACDLRDAPGFKREKTKWLSSFQSARCLEIGKRPVWAHGY